MEIERLNKREVRFVLDNEWLSKYNITVEDMLSEKPFDCKVTDDMFRKAKKELKVSFNKNFPCRMFKGYDNTVVMDIPIKENFKQKIIKQWNKLKKQH